MNRCDPALEIEGIVRPPANSFRAGWIMQTCRCECCDLRAFLVIRPVSTCYPGNVGLEDLPHPARKVNGPDRRPR